MVVFLDSHSNTRQKGFPPPPKKKDRPRCPHAAPVCHTRRNSLHGMPSHTGGSPSCRPQSAQPFSTSFAPLFALSAPKARRKGAGSPLKSFSTCPWLPFLSPASTVSFFFFWRRFRKEKPHRRLLGFHGIQRLLQLHQVPPRRERASAPAREQWAGPIATLRPLLKWLRVKNRYQNGLPW